MAVLDKGIVNRVNIGFDYQKRIQDEISRITMAFNAFKILNIFEEMIKPDSN